MPTVKSSVRITHSRISRVKFQRKEFSLNTNTLSQIPTSNRTQAFTLSSLCEVLNSEKVFCKSRLSKIFESTIRHRKPRKPKQYSILQQRVNRFAKSVRN